MHIIRVLKFSSLVRCHWPALVICTFFSFVLTFALHIHVILSLSTTVEDNSSGVLLHQQICLIYLTTITRAPLLMLRLRYSTYMNIYVCIEQQTGRKIKSKRYQHAGIDNQIPIFGCLCKWTTQKNMQQQISVENLRKCIRTWVGVCCLDRKPAKV